jgi:hypothetical protein
VPGPFLAGKLTGAAQQICSFDASLPNAGIAALLNLAVMVLSRGTVVSNSYQSAVGNV